MPILGVIASSLSGKLVNPAYEYISQYTVSGSAVSSFTLSSIPTTYKTLVLKGYGASSSGGTNWNITSSSGGSYYWAQGYGSGSGSWAANSYGTGAYLGPFIGSSWGQFTMTIVDYAASKNKSVNMFGGADLNGSGYVGIGNASSTGTGAINSLTVAMGGGNIQVGSSFYLYGIK
jgi:hypothetical protein